MEKISKTEYPERKNLTEIRLEQEHEREELPESDPSKHNNPLKFPEADLGYNFKSLKSKKRCLEEQVEQLRTVVPRIVQQNGEVTDSVVTNTTQYLENIEKILHDYENGVAQLKTKLEGCTSNLEPSTNTDSTEISDQQKQEEDLEEKIAQAILDYELRVLQCNQLFHKLCKLYSNYNSSSSNTSTTNSSDSLSSQEESSSNNSTPVEGDLSSPNSNSMENNTNLSTISIQSLIEEDRIEKLKKFIEHIRKERNENHKRILVPSRLHLELEQFSDFFPLFQHQQHQQQHHHQHQTNLSSTSSLASHLSERRKQLIFSIKVMLSLNQEYDRLNVFLLPDDGLFLLDHSADFYRC